MESASEDNEPGSTKSMSIKTAVKPRKQNYKHEESKSSKAASEKTAAASLNGEVESNESGRNVGGKERG